jgi:hypothetical protein
MKVPYNVAWDLFSEVLCPLHGGRRVAAIIPQNSGQNLMPPSSQLISMHRVSLFVFCAFIISTAWASQKELKILAFGDSLTAGLSATREFQSIHHPYAIKLIELLLSKVKVNITNGGVSGDMVIDAMHQQLVGGRQDNMQMRLNRFLTEAEKNGTIYDWVLLMAGRSSLRSSSASSPLTPFFFSRNQRHQQQQGGGNYHDWPHGDV